MLDGTAFASEVVMSTQVPVDWMSCSLIQEKLPAGSVGKIQAVVVSHDSKLRDMSRKSNVEDMGFTLTPPKYIFLCFQQSCKILTFCYHDVFADVCFLFCI